MNYIDYYLEASQTSDKISRGELVRRGTQSPPENKGFTPRRPTKPLTEAPAAGFEDALLMYLSEVKGMRIKKEFPDASELAPETSARPPSKGFIDTGDEKLMLAKTIQAEAGNQGPDGMLAVGAVIANRSRTGKWGESLTDVILSPGQFSAWNSVTGYAGGEQGQDMSNVRPSEEALNAAEAIIEGGYQDPTDGALNYFAIIPGVSEKPAWANDGFKKLGDHYFGTAG
jgi:spore germination cell wall hydrolase CwlJ-like protein